MNFYIVLTQNFCETHATYRVGVSQFNYAITNDGRYVTSANALNDFPELFDSTNLPQIIGLSITDFPTPIGP